jgi:ABC-type polysaccharide/polyol phosphate transport system ATPase subunit
MTGESNIVLELDHVSRLYPRDISDTPSAILREMLLPCRLLNTPGPDSFFALRNVSLRLRKGQKLGVIGAHRSGKTSLAGVASGVLLPTSGSVSAQGSRLLISRPTAGFKPILTSIENLRLRASLAGLHGERLDAVLHRTLSRCGVDAADARTPMGNLSPYVIKQLGLTLLLELPADILVVDGISSAGIGDARWQTRGLLQEKIDASTALVISSDFGFIQEVVEEAVLLHHGRLYGPFSLEKAIDCFNKLPEEDFTSETGRALYDPSTLPRSLDYSARAFINGSSNSDALDGLSGSGLPEDRDQEDFTGKGKLEIKKMWSPVAKLEKISVDGIPYSHAKFSLIRNPFDVLNLELTLLFRKSCIVSGFTFCLHSEFGEELAPTKVPSPHKRFSEKSLCLLSLSIEIPEIPLNSYGLSITPIEDGTQETLKDRMKILKFGVSGKPAKHNDMALKISNLLINTRE